LAAHQTSDTDAEGINTLCQAPIYSSVPAIDVGMLIDGQLPGALADGETDQHHVAASLRRDSQIGDTARRWGLGHGLDP